jgi:hypothetical protein
MASEENKNFMQIFKMRITFNYNKNLNLKRTKKKIHILYSLFPENEN